MSTWYCESGRADFVVINQIDVLIGINFHYLSVLFVRARVDCPKRRPGKHGSFNRFGQEGTDFQ